MKVPGKKIKPVITVLSTISLLFSNIAFGNGGINTGTTLVLEHSQYPAALKKYNATKVYILYWGTGFSAKELQGTVLRKDTIINYKKFTESFPNATGYRLIYSNNENDDSYSSNEIIDSDSSNEDDDSYSSNEIIDSAWQLDARFRIRIKAYTLDDEKLHILAFDSTMKKTDEFIFNWGEKDVQSSNTRGRSDGLGPMTLGKLLRQYEIYSSYDRNNYAKGSVWILSIGIDRYGPNSPKNLTCKTDAESYTDFFKKQYTGGKDSSFSTSLVHEYLLLEKDATKEAILDALKDIARKSSFNDYFIFSFSGLSGLLTKDSIKSTYCFLPYNVVFNMRKAVNEFKNGVSNRNTGDTTAVWDNLISLDILQEYIQSIPANNQLFISEAGPSKNFKTEFIKTLMQNSPEVASILNKNRVIIVPNKVGYDNVSCLGNKIQKGPINYYITSLDSANIYDLFKEEYQANKVTFRIKNKAYNCRSFDYEYFDIFFERKFLKDYKEIFGDANGQTRGLGLKTKELKEAGNFSGKGYALVVGTNNYKAAGWKKLPNAINDARAVSEMLAQGYGFDVQLLEDKPMDSIYKAIGDYYRKLQPNDQLILYFAGHGDMESEFMDDGFIVCSDSKSRDDDPARNSYIQYVKLQKMINKIPARQILVMLDVCHGGVFNQKRSDPGAKAIANRNVRQFLVDQSQYICRKFLSSVGSEEAFDGKPGDHSPFAKLLLQVLNAKGKETNDIVTLGNIFAVLQTASMNKTATLKISPQRDGFGADNPQSDFILIPVERNGGKE